MSRIDEALRQAGLRSQGERTAEGPSALDNFPVSSDSQSPADDLQLNLAAPPAATIARTVAEKDRPHAMSPRSEVAPSASSTKFRAAEKLVIHDKTGQGCIEQYRRVAAMLHQLQEERGMKVIMVASAQMSEGKTLTAANLALTLSESYQRRVLLIDADLRRPSLTTLFHLQSISGLSESLRSATLAPFRVLELSDRLSLLPGGRPDPDPMAGLTSGRLQKIVEQAAASYDWVILDTPPVSLQPDARLIAAIVEATVFVIGAGISQSNVVQSAIETIGRDKIIGVVLNRVDANAFNEAAYYDYYYNQRSVGPRDRQLSSVVAGT